MMPSARKQEKLKYIKYLVTVFPASYDLNSFKERDSLFDVFDTKFPYPKFPYIKNFPYLKFFFFYS